MAGLSQCHRTGPMALLPLHVQWASLSSVFPSPCQVPPHCHSFLSWFGERVLAISVPVSPMGFPVLKTICFGGGGECGRDRVGRQDLGLLLASQVLESYSENQGGKKKKKKHRKALRPIFVLLCPPISDHGHPLSSRLSFLDSKSTELG